MTWWTTADLHIGHANILGYCNRPFKDVDEMNQALIDNWNDRVRPGDDIWVLGDLAMGKIRDSLELVQFLNGTITLVPGNHDRCWTGHKKGVQKWTTEYLNAGINTILHNPPVHSIGGKRVKFHHFPVVGDSGTKDRYASMRPVPDGTWNVLCHGHVHDTFKTSFNQVNVGVDVWGYAPVAVEEAVSLIP